MTLLHEAARTAQVHVFKHLLDNQADIQVVDEVSGVSCTCYTLFRVGNIYKAVTNYC